MGLAAADYRACPPHARSTAGVTVTQVPNSAAAIAGNLHRPLNVAPPVSSVPISATAAGAVGISLHRLPREGPPVCRYDARF